MKRLIVCCDGTWQSSVQGRHVSPSNPARFSYSLSKTFTDLKGVEHPQIVFYNAGVGTETSWWAKQMGGITGAGLEEDVCKVYNFLATNYEQGDEIFFFGFSRGAYTARAAAGLVCRVGLCATYSLWRFWEMYAVYRSLKPDQDIFEHPDWCAKTNDDRKEKEYFPLDVQGERYGIEKGGGLEWIKEPYAENVTVKVVGVWDTVGARGIPPNVIWDVGSANSKYEFHDTRINVEAWKSHIENAFHALALDEHRAPFTPTLWKLPKGSKCNLIQCWFPGVHINVGGGNLDMIQNKPSDREFLSNITFAWMVDRCARFLKFAKLDGILQFATLYFEAVIKERVEHAEEQPQGWSLGRMVDSYKGFHYRTAGSVTRTPGAYYWNEFAGEGVPWITNECVHPVVWFAKDKHHYKLQALSGFERVSAGKGQGHYWTSTCRPPDTHYLTEDLKATLATPYRFAQKFSSKKRNKKPTQLEIRLPEFVIPERIELDGGEEDSESSMERLWILFSNRAKLQAAEYARGKSTYDSAAANAETAAYLAELDAANKLLLPRSWLEAARELAPEPLIYHFEKQRGARSISQSTASSAQLEGPEPESEPES